MSGLDAGDVRRDTPAAISSVDRIRAEYERRRREIPRERYALTTPSVLFASQHTARAMIAALRMHDLLPLRGRRVLDVGCGAGERLLELETWGARRADLAGIDIDEWRIGLARQRLCAGPSDTEGKGEAAATADLRLGDATHLPWPDGHFDIVMQSTAFSSFPDAGMRRSVAAEMLRVLNTRGALVWYDLAVRNPANRHVTALPIADVRRLFPGCTIWARRVTLAPPVARRLVPVNWSMASLVELFPPMRSHLLAVIRP